MQATEPRSNARASRGRPSACGSLGDPSGFTLIEAVIVLAITGIMISMGLSTLSAWTTREGPREAAAVVAGSLQLSRSRAVQDGFPRLVFFEPQLLCDETGRSPLATIVEDVDRSFSITPGDVVTSFEFPGELDCEVGAYAGGLIPPEPGESPAAFPIHSGTLTQAFAFLPNGMTANPEDPTMPGSASGAVYIYNSAGDVYAVSVRPLGNVAIKKFDTMTGTWH